MAIEGCFHSSKQCVDFLHSVYSIMLWFVRLGESHDISEREHHINLHSSIKMEKPVHIWCIISKTLNSQLWEIIYFYTFG